MDLFTYLFFKINYANPTPLHILLKTFFFPFYIYAFDIE